MAKLVTGAPRSVTVLGATGSVGRSTADLLASEPGRFRVEALTAATNADSLVEMARRLTPRFVAIANEAHYKAVKTALAGMDIEVAAGPDAVLEAARRDADLVIAAIVGAAGLPPTLEAVRRGATVALANKEALVCTGPLMAAEVAKSGATLLPIDSEHNAVFQVFDFERPETIDKIILTASGGPFREADRKTMARATPSDACNHPVWSMGAKISVDSATMMNKGLEVIEAHYLFPLAEERPGDRIEVLVHPQSVVHSMVSYRDGSFLAQLGTPDMKIPIAYALAWPDRMDAQAERLDLVRIGSLHFEAPNPEKFPAIGLARAALREGGSAPAVLNAANEVAVARFLEGGLGFLDIASVVEETLQQVNGGAVTSVEEVIQTDLSARRMAESIVRRMA
ncbi:MAG: 1-deoxy-D-xylulose-5-phosphate reductoisomerase [Alphaproteobacteria bacterium]|nr:1-deoxy-D-xylulose-5-phosphate reductoisomerase [Alphaproteobacteria bacterium]